MEIWSFKIKKKFFMQIANQYPTVTFVTQLYTYIHCWSTSHINKSIICQDAREKRFLLHYLENTLTRSLFLPLGLLLVDLDT